MFYIFHGDEQFAQAEEVAKLKAQVAADGTGELNIAVLDGRRLRFEGLVNACNALPFLGERRLVIVQGLLQRLEARGREEGGPEETAGEGESSRLAEQLVAYLPALPPTARLLFVEGKTLSARNPVLKLAKQMPDAHVREFSTLGPGDIQSWVRRRAQEKNVAIEPAAVSLLVAFVGSDLRSLDQELEKLAAYTAYTGTIQVAHVRALVSAAQEANVFRLVDALGERDGRGALRQLEALIADEINELYLLTMVARQFRLILAAKESAAEQGPDLQRLRRELGLSHTFIVEKLLKQSQRFTFEEIERIQKRVVDLDQSIKTGRIDGRLGLELLVLDACQRTKRPPAHSQASSRSRTR